jgi:hypothetical protein
MLTQTIMIPFYWLTKFGTIYDSFIDTLEYIKSDYNLNM